MQDFERGFPLLHIIMHAEHACINMQSAIGLSRACFPRIILRIVWSEINYDVFYNGIITIIILG